MTEGCVIIRSEAVKALALRSDADLNEWAYFIILKPGLPTHARSSDHENMQVMRRGTRL